MKNRLTNAEAKKIALQQLDDYFKELTSKGEEVSKNFKGVMINSVEENGGWTRLEPDGRNFPTEGRNFVLFLSDGSAVDAIDIPTFKEYTEKLKPRQFATHYMLRQSYPLPKY